MRGIGRTGLCLVAVLVVGAIAAATASAAEYEVEGIPEFGRCVPVPKGTGEYKGAYCLAPAAGKGNHNWLPGPGEKNTFVGSAGPITLETVGGYKFKCSSGEFSGEYSSPKTASVTLVFQGCIDIQTVQNCQTNPSKGGEITNPTPIEAELGFIQGGEKPKVGLDLKPATPIAFSCGSGPEVTAIVSVSGSVIGTIKRANSMRSTFKLIYTATKGKQIPEKFEEGLNDTLSLQKIVGLETTTEQAGLTIIGIEEIPKPLIIENEEPIEIKAK
jgi:hypothetical protein